MACSPQLRWSSAPARFVAVNTKETPGPIESERLTLDPAGCTKPVQQIFNPKESLGLTPGESTGPTPNPKQVRSTLGSWWALGGDASHMESDAFSTEP